MTDRFGILHDYRFSQDLLSCPNQLDFVEVIPDRFMSMTDLANLSAFWSAIPTVFHSLNLSIGSIGALDRSYLQKIVALAKHLNPMWISDHLAITRSGQMQLGHLSPIRMSAGAITRIADKVAFIQDQLRLQFLIENIAYYFTIPGADLREAELLQRLVDKTGCGLLLDLNNVVVNANNHRFDPFEYLDEFPLGAVREIHIAGHRRNGELYIDSHGEPVGQAVWDLLKYVAAKVDSINVILERDQDMPPFTDLIAELAIARRYVAAGRTAS
jgi:uncharacterized protein